MAQLPPDVVTPYHPAMLNPHGCRQLVAAVLWKAAYDASVGKEDAVAWLHGEYSAHLAGLLDITDWPPNARALARVRASRAHTVRAAVPAAAGTDGIKNGRA